MPGTARQTVRRRLTAAAAAAVALGSAVMVAGAAAPAAAAPHAFKVTGYDITAGSPKKPVSSTGKKLTYFFSISAETANKSYAVNPDLSTAVEFHSWSFPLTGSAFSVNPAKGTGKVDTRGQLKAFGRFKLKLSSAGKAKKICPDSSGYTTDRPIKLVGTPTFDSNSGKHGWGTVDKHQVTLKGILSTTYGSPTGGCGSSRTVCSRVGVEVSGFAGSTDLSAESFSGRAASIIAFRSVRLRSPHGAFREDEISGVGAPLKLTKNGSKAAVTVKGTSKTVSGSATVTSTEAPVTSGCKKTTTTTYFGSWKNSKKKLTLHAQIEGNLGLANTTDSQIEVVTKK